MRMKIVLAGLIMVMVPLFMGCQISPSDKWPAILTWENVYNFDTTVTLNALGLPSFTVIDSSVETTVTVRTYHINQDFSVRIVVDRIVAEALAFSVEELEPLGSVLLLDDDPGFWLLDPAEGIYIPGSGAPPQGNVNLVINWEVPKAADSKFFQTLIPEISSEPIYLLVTREDFFYRCIVEDAGGRTDSYNFQLTGYTIIGEEE